MKAIRNLSYWLMVIATMMCCISCRGLFRDQLSKADAKLMVHIFGERLAKEIRLKRVAHQTSNWMESYAHAIYEVEMTSATLAKIASSGMVKREDRKALTNEEFEYYHDITYRAVGRFTQYGYSEIREKIKDGLIDEFWGNGWGVYADRSAKPLGVYLYVSSDDLLRRI